jgi:ubiquinone/menaquinone biosynthesis C-methylase UbiE
MNEKTLFDEWPEWYENWFTTPIGKLVRETESVLVHDLLRLKPGEDLLDAGCGTGIFTYDFLKEEARVTGLDVSRPMLDVAQKKLTGYPIDFVAGDMLCLPFKDNSFDKAVSVTALEFIEDANAAVSELFRVTRPGGLIVVATLNSLSPWAVERKARTHKHLLQDAFFRSPNELLACGSAEGTAATCVHFERNELPERAVNIEKTCLLQRLNTGAFVAARWKKPK